MTPNLYFHTSPLHIYISMWPQLPTQTHPDPASICWFFVRRRHLFSAYALGSKTNPIHFMHMAVTALLRLFNSLTFTSVICRVLLLCVIPPSTLLYLGPRSTLDTLGCRCFAHLHGVVVIQSSFSKRWMQVQNAPSTVWADVTNVWKRHHSLQLSTRRSRRP